MFFVFSHFAETILTADPDVVALQEVRLDSSFFSVENTLAFWKNDSEYKLDAGSQVEHLLHHLSAARKRLNIPEAHQYQVVYQPAMSMWEKCEYLNFFLHHIYY